MPPKGRTKKSKAKAKASAKAAARSKVSEEIVKLFKKFDTDGNGAIDRTELVDVLQRVGLAEAEADRLLAAIDTSSDGLIQYEEFVDWVMAGSDESKAVVALGRIALSVVTASGKAVLEVAVPEDTSIADIRQRLTTPSCQAEGIAPGVVKLVWGGEEVADATSLAALGLPAQGAALQVNCDTDAVTAALDHAVEVLNTMDRRDFAPDTRWARPPLGVEMTMEVVHLLLEGRVDRRETAQAVVNNPNLLTRLREFDRDNIERRTLQQVRKYVIRPEYQPHVMALVNRSAAILCAWTHAMYAYAMARQSAAESPSEPAAEPS